MNGDPVARYRRALEGVLGVPATEGNQVEVLLNGDEIFPAMLDAIGSARRTIDFMTFVYWEGSTGAEFAEALADKARAGLRVRVLLDALGALTIDKHWVDQMRDGGAQVEWFRPVNKIHFWESENRSHRKVLVCDEEVAFTGGIGIADEWRGNATHEGEWRDTHFRVKGPAVDGIRAAFVQNWAETGRNLIDSHFDQFPAQPATGNSVVQVVRGTAQAGWSDITTLMRTLLCLAEEQVRITTAYFVPDDDTIRLLTETAERGVKVEILLPGPHIDKRFVQLASESHYQPLLDAGVNIWAFQPTMLHAKVITVDGLVATVGSANFTSRSLILDDEANLVIFDPDIVRQLDEHFEFDVLRSQGIDATEWPDRSILQKVKETVADIGGRHM